jgi:hypothetical protein
MPQPTFFTVTADFRSVLADTEIDLDADGQIVPISAVVTFKPVLRDGDAIRAINASPRPIGYVPAPVVAKLGTDGRLKLRDDPDGTRVIVATYANLPATGNVANYYRVTATGLYYRWNGSGYDEIPPHQPVRLLANTELLDLGFALYYTVTFSQVIYNGRAGKLRGFTFEAPRFDTEVSLIEVMPEPGDTGGRGINTQFLQSAYFNEDGKLVFVNAGGSAIAPIDIPSGVLVFIDNGDSTWSVE